MKLIPTTDFKLQIWSALLISAWLVVFLVLAAPYDVSDLSLKLRLFLMPPYGLITFMGYLCLIPFQNRYYQKTQKWSLVEEVIFLVALFVVVYAGCIVYYYSSHINGTYTISEFTLNVYTPTFFILLVLVVIVRWFLFRSNKTATSKKIEIYGENKRDVLHINMDHLICISSADNYVEIYFLQHGEIQKRLMRNTLKQVKSDLPDMVQVHRSHILNPTHFISWKGNDQIQTSAIKLPVSKKYKEGLLSRFGRP